MYGTAGHVGNRYGGSSSQDFEDIQNSLSFQYKKQHTCIKNKKPPQQQSLVTHQKKMMVTTKMGIATCSNCYYNLIFIYMYHNNCRSISSYHSFSLLKDKLEKHLQLLTIINSKWIIFGHWLTKRKSGCFKPIKWIWINKRRCQRKFQW
jgi:hypothetical protein